jgi:hypothetical protein
MASRALTARFMMTCSICPDRLTAMWARAPDQIDIFPDQPGQHFRFSVTTPFRSTILGASICLRLKAN